MFSFPRRLVLGLICWLSALFVANNAHAAFGDIVAQYTFPASSLVMSPTQALMYATIPSQNSIAIINTNTLAASTVFVGSGPANLAFSPDGSKAYIANSTSNFVVVFNTQTHTVTNSFQLPEHPADVVFGTQNRLWVLGATQIFQIDATTGASTGPSISNPPYVYSGSLEISPDRNTLYYADYGLSPATMYKINVSGTNPVVVLETPFGTAGENGEDLSLSHNGNFICFATGGGQSNYDIAKFRTSDFASLGSFYIGPYPQAVTFSQDDQVVYASVATGNGIKVFNANTFTQSGFISGQDVANKLAVDSTGRLLFAGYTLYYSNFLGTIVYDTGRYDPAAPAAHPATYVASNSFTANWSSVNGATGYQLDVATDSSFTTYVTGYHNLNVGNTTSRSVTGLNPSTVYYYRVRAYNGIATSGNSKTISVTTLTATGPPVVITSPATLIASFSATLNGSLDPHGLTTTVHFQYGTTISYGLTTAPQSQAGSTYRNISANISGLLASTTYHFRIVATNSAGTRYGADRVFTTLSPTGPPVVTTNPANYIASFSATLNGTVDPHGLTTTVYFQYGTTNHGLTSTTQTQSGNTYRNVGIGISGLAASTTYHFRIVATNSAGTTYGADRTFTTLSATGPPVVITNPATNVASFSATLNGVVDPHGLSTSMQFQYGTTTNYGLTTAAQSHAGSTYLNISAHISGLTTETTYHFRIVATNSAGTSYGADRAFTTQ